MIDWSLNVNKENKYTVTIYNWFLVDIAKEDISFIVYSTIRSSVCLSATT